MKRERRKETETIGKGRGKREGWRRRRKQRMQTLTHSPSLFPKVADIRLQSHTGLLLVNQAVTTGGRERAEFLIIYCVTAEVRVK